MGVQVAVRVVDCPAVMVEGVGVRTQVGADVVVVLSHSHSGK